MASITRWLGVSHRVGGLMSYWILTQKSTVISITAVQRLTSLEKDTDKDKASISEFDTEKSLCFREKEDLTYDGSNPNPKNWSEYLKYDPDFQEEFYSIIYYSNVPEADANFTLDVFDETYLNM